MKVKIVNIIDSKTFKAEAKSYKPHKKYGKFITSHRNFMVHNPSSVDLKIGDEVVIEQSRPISKTKKWVLKGKAGN